MVKVSIVQMKSSMDKEENLQYSLEQIKESAKNSAKIICFPEFQMSFSPSSQSSEELFSLSESKHGNFVSQLKKSARDNNIFIVGSIYERANSKQTKKIQSQRNFDKDSYRVFDTVVLINNKGRLVSQYRKLHLYDALGFRNPINY
jgi:predicted amidohydrolase